MNAIATTDVLVVGAGPAGLTLTAGLLRRNARDAMVLEIAESHAHLPETPALRGSAVA